MRFGLLGSLEVIDDDGRAVDVGGAQPRTVLAVLLVADGSVVTADALVDAVWGDAPPASANGTLQTYVSRLRRALEPARSRGVDPTVLIREPSGYRLAVGPDDVDVRRFESLADQGRELMATGKPAEARDALVQADALWRGPALVEYRHLDTAAGLAARLEDRRLAAVEDRLAADLALGRHGAAVGELTELVANHPLQEGFQALLALALYRAGRQAEALRVLDAARSTLREELGVDPGRDLQELEAAILAQDPALDLGPTARSTGAAAPETAAAGSAAAPPVDATEGFVGRATELGQLLAALDESTAAPRSVVIEGAPGIGKTRLAEELADRASHRGTTVLWGRAFEGGAAPAFWPWLPPLRALAEDGRTSFDDTATAPELRALLSAGGGDPSTPSGVPGAAEVARYTLADAVVALIADRAAVRPILLVLDDIQWADVASLELLTAVTSRLVDSPVLIVCTVRELDVGRNDAVVDALAALTRSSGSRRLQLRGLTDDESAELVSATTGREVDPSTSASIRDRAEGNPFFITELARLVAGSDGPVADDVPSGVRDVVRRRLAMLSPGCRELLDVGAVIGRDVDLSLLSRASGRDLDDCLDDLEPAMLQRLLVPAADHPGGVRFGHALVREVLADDISALRRARLHLRVADALVHGDDSAEIVAEHLWSAVPIGVARRAAGALERAAEVAVRRMAYAAAEDLLGRAAQLRRAEPDPDDPDAELRTVARLVSVISARRGYAALADSPVLARGLELAEQAGQDLELLNLKWAEWAGLDVSNQFRAADPIAAELLALTQRSDLALAGVIGHTAYGISCWHRGEVTEAARHMDTARDMAAAFPPEELDSVLFDVDQIKLCFPFSVYLHVLIGDVDDPARSFQELIAMADGDPFWELLVLNFEASGGVSTGRPDVTIRAGRRAEVIDPDSTFAFWSYAIRAYLGGALCLQGEVDEGLPIADWGWSRFAASGSRTNGATFLAARTFGLASAGRLDEARASYADAERELDQHRDLYAQPSVMMARALIEHHAGDPVAASITFEDAAALADHQGSHAMASWIRTVAGRTARSVPSTLD